jgi:uncharacterized protein (TIGR03086 family)
MDLLEALTEVFDHTTKVVSGVGRDQLDHATPCSEWNVRALLMHTFGAMVNIGRGARGEDLLADGNAFPLDEDLAGQFRTEADLTLRSWTDRGLDGLVNIGAGPMPAVVGLTVNVLDTGTHSWDIARATGQDANLPDALAATLLATAHGFVNDDIRRFAGFYPAVAVAENASLTDQLAAYMGRQP